MTTDVNLIVSEFTAKCEWNYEVNILNGYNNQVDDMITHTGFVITYAYIKRTITSGHPILYDYAK